MSVKKTENNPQVIHRAESLVDKSRAADPAFDAALKAVKAMSPTATLRHVQLDGEQQGAPLTWTRKDEEGYRARVAAWKAAGSPEPPGCSLPPMRGPAYKKRGRR